MTPDEIVKALRDWWKQGYRERSEAFTLVKQSADLIESMKSQLAASQRREQAAVADIKKPSVCECCVHCWACQGDEVCLDNDYMNFEWRGPQEAGKGDAE